MMMFSVLAITVLLSTDLCAAFEFKEKNCGVDSKPDGITANPDTRQPPYSIFVSDTKYKPGQTLKVTVVARYPRTFLNAMIMTSCEGCGTYGVFSPGPDVPSTSLNCFGKTALKFKGTQQRLRISFHPGSLSWLLCATGNQDYSSIFANTNVPREIYAVNWTPGDNVRKPLTFRVIVVHNETTWWPDVRSPELTRDGPIPEPEPETNSPPVGPTQPETAQATSLSPPVTEPETTQLTPVAVGRAVQFHSGSGDQISEYLVLVGALVLWMFLGKPH